MIKSISFEDILEKEQKKQAKKKSRKAGNISSSSPYNSYTVFKIATKRKTTPEGVMNFINYIIKDDRAKAYDDIGNIIDIKNYKDVLNAHWDLEDSRKQRKAVTGVFSIDKKDLPNTEKNRKKLELITAKVLQKMIPNNHYMFAVHRDSESGNLHSHLIIKCNSFSDRLIELDKIKIEDIHNEFNRECEKHGIKISKRKVRKNNKVLIKDYIKKIVPVTSTFLERNIKINDKSLFGTYIHNQFEAIYGKKNCSMALQIFTSMYKENSAFALNLLKNEPSFFRIKGSVEGKDIKYDNIDIEKIKEEAFSRNIPYTQKLTYKLPKTDKIPLWIDSINKKNLIIPNNSDYLKLKQEKVDNSIINNVEINKLFKDCYGDKYYNSALKSFAEMYLENPSYSLWMIEKKPQVFLLKDYKDEIISFDKPFKINNKALSEELKGVSKVYSPFISKFFQDAIPNWVDFIKSLNKESIKNIEFYHEEKEVFNSLYTEKFSNDALYLFKEIYKQNPQVAFWIIKKKPELLLSGVVITDEEVSNIKAIHQVLQENKDNSLINRLYKFNEVESGKQR